MDDINFFELAVEQYANVWLSFLLDHCPYSRIEGTCVGLKNGHLVVRAKISDAFKQPIIWGSAVQGYFRIRDTEIVHCHFVTKLVRIYNAPPDLLLLVMPLPENVDHNQRRYSRRVGMHDDRIDDSGLWHGSLSGGDEDALPLFRWVALADSYCQLSELSATGMRLEMSKDTQVAKSINLNDWILLRGNFGTMGKSLPLFVLGNVVRKMADPEQKELLCIGCQFTSWRKIQNSRDNTWFRCNEDGIAQIAQWISRNFRGLVV